MKRSRRAPTLALMCGLAVTAGAARATAESVTLKEFLAEVTAANLDYAAARYNVSIAQAQLVAAQTSPNPTFTLGTAGRDITDSGSNREPANNEISVAETIEIGGKRSRRVAAARATVAQAGATLQDFFRTLRGNAATAFIDALTKRRIVAEKQRSADALEQLVAANKRRFELGDIGEIDLTQSRVDAQQYHADTLASESDAQIAELALVQFLGRLRADTPTSLTAAGDLSHAMHKFDAATLSEAALHNRPDVMAARHAVEAGQANLKVAEALVVPDATVSFSYQDNQRSFNEIAPAPAYSSIGLSVSLPIPLFNGFRGEREVARETLAQAEVSLKNTELHAKVDVLQALARLELANQRAAQYEGGALDDATVVLKGKLFSYEHGAATLLDVLNAQRADNDVRLSYLDALDERAKALVGVEQAAGIWDIDF